MVDNQDVRKLKQHAEQLARDAAVATAGAGNEATLRHELEKALERHCRGLGLPWVPFQLDMLVRNNEGGRARYLDVSHGAVIIEYEPPASFRGHEGARLQHARAQAEEYAVLLQGEEGRDLSEYVLVSWDGSHISFGRYRGAQAEWDRLVSFDVTAAQLLLSFLQSQGAPLVHPQLLLNLVGPESGHGAGLIPVLFGAVRRAAASRTPTTKTRLLFMEWRRLFGQVVGVQSDRLRALLEDQGKIHGQPYAADPVAYLFSLNTYIALVAKLVAALALPDGSQDLTDSAVPIQVRIGALESGELFRASGISNMLAGDFFSWYRDDPDWVHFAPLVEDLLAALSGVSFDVTRKSPESTRDLFKGMYQSFVPRALRHALGEYYTPDWLAAHALDTMKWRPKDPLLDPTCGSGTFLLEALRRRLSVSGSEAKTAQELLRGIYGIDLNPLAVLAARASIVVSLAPCLKPGDPLDLPVYLADAINPASVEGASYDHRLQTELGVMHFRIPRSVVEHPRFFAVFARIRELVEAGYAATKISDTLAHDFPELSLREPEKAELGSSLEILVELQQRGWNGIWCAILADRFAAGSIPPVAYIAGNPPWVKWSHLPPEYAEFIKERCLDLGVFSEDRWVGGIESDISTVITYEVIDKWLAPRGVLAFFITGSVFANESSQGFRRFELQNRRLHFRVVRVEDFDALGPFEDVDNHPTLLVVKRDEKTAYPVPYRVWSAPKDTRVGSRPLTQGVDLLAEPVPGTDAGPWLKGTAAEHRIWKKVFGTREQAYTARKGITTDRNGIFFVELIEVSEDGRMCTIRNVPEIGRTRGIQQVREVVEAEHVFPLLRGRGVAAFSAIPDPEYRVLLPQRGMHGDPGLPEKAPGAYRFLRRFKSELERRSSYLRFQRGQPYWSVWSTGAYTFSAFKVVWKEMSGGRFVAAYTGRHKDPSLGRKIVIPDHKLYFVPVETEAEAAYLAGLLNARTITRAISAYAAQLSLGVSVVEYLAIPPFNPEDATHASLSKQARAITARGGNPTPEELAVLDSLALRLF